MDTIDLKNQNSTDSIYKNLSDEIIETIVKAYKQWYNECPTISLGEYVRKFIKNK